MESCPSCGRELAADDKYCRGCGSELKGDQSPAKDASIVVAVFNDLTGWAGKGIMYGDGVFHLDEVGDLRASDLLHYAGQGYLEWADARYEAWVTDIASTAPRRWTTVDPGTNEYLSDVFFLDSQHGWTAGGAGIVLRTQDSGRTWTSVRGAVGERIMAITFVDACRGWAGCWDGTVMATTDGGSTWSVQTKSSSFPAYDVAFLDASTGWVLAANNELLTTADGGLSWNRQTVERGGNALGAMCLVDAEHGWLAGSDGTVASTDDGGRTWDFRSLGHQFWFQACQFVDPLHGWFVGEAGIRTGAIVSTSDGGSTWACQYTGPSGCFQDVAFCDLQCGRAISTSEKSDKGLVLATFDGGATWVPEEHENRFGLGALALPDRLHGWAVGWDGIMLEMTVS